MVWLCRILGPCANVSTTSWPLCGPESRTPWLLGEYRASRSKVRRILLSLALNIWLLAWLLKHKEQTFNLATSWTCMLSNIVLMTTAVLFSKSGNFIFWIIQERDLFGRLEQLMNSPFSTIWLKVKLVHLARNLNSLTKSLR